MNEEKCSNYVQVDVGQTKQEGFPRSYERNEGQSLAKRRAKFDAATKSNKTPTESMPDNEFALEATSEDAIKGANRNSKKGYQNGKQE